MLDNQLIEVKEKNESFIKFLKLCNGLLSDVVKS